MKFMIRADESCFFEEIKGIVEAIERLGYVVVLKTNGDFYFQKKEGKGK